MKLLTRWPYLFALLLSLLVLRTLLPNVWYPMHDTTHIARLFLYDQALKRGEYPPIWAEGINNNLGYPLFHFYAPLFYQLAYIFSLVGDYFFGLKLALGLFVFVGIISVMRLVAGWGRGAMVLAGTLFATSPYLAVNLYVRGAYAETAAMCLFPLVLLFWRDIATRKKQVLAGVVTAFFVMSHNLLPVLAFPIFAIYVLLFHSKNLSVIIFPSIVTLLVSSSYLLPLFFERNFVQADVIAKTSDYKLHFVAPWQIWNSTWGYGGSASGVEDGLSFKMGKIHLLLAISGSLWLVAKKKWEAIFAIFALYCLFMTTNYSAFVWQSIPFLPLAQFPWRHLALAASLLAFLGAASINLVKIRLLRFAFVAMFSLCALFLNLKYFVPQTTFLAKIEDFTNQKYLSTVADIIPEYKPRWQTINSLDSLPTFTHQNGLTTIARAYYPTWEVFLDGAKTSTFANDQGLLTIKNPNASDNIIFRQSHTYLQQFGYALTFVGYLITIYYLFAKK